MCRLAWSFTARICDKYINHKNKWPEPSFTSLLLSAISEGSGETAQMCSLARSFAARICDFFMNWSINLSLSLHPHPFILMYSLFASAIGTNRSWIGVKFGTSLHLHPFFLGIGCSQLRLVPNCLELVYKIWPVSSSTSLLFRDSLSANAISTKLSWTSLHKLASAFINMLLGYAITCSTKLSWTSLSKLAWVFTYISSF